ncbi:hypothetical protein A8926_6575 [Saccharopolyspora spinosa]|uniref:Uncharacterized protein n=1 Tax=Saccharopolyspora spinosa TaxID=60894 RepID=A0A2N3Y6D2_SACSN|nr:hypothetical protein A8926_6575 [Saccharopolyspora spinosa]
MVGEYESLPVHETVGLYPEARGLTLRGYRIFRLPQEQWSRRCHAAGRKGTTGTIGISNP